MGNNITDRLKYKESIVKFSRKYGVAKAAYKFGECKRTIYRWRDRYDGTLESLKDKSRRPHSHPNQHTEEEIRTYILQDYCMSSGGEKYHYEAIDILKRSIGEKFII